MGPVLGVVAFTASIYTAIKQRKAQRRAAEAARQAARDAAAVQVRNGPAASPIQVLYGRIGTYGIKAYVTTGDNLPLIGGTTTIEGSSNTLGSLRPGSGQSRKRQYMLVQTILSVAELEQMMHVIVNDESIRDVDSKINGASVHLFHGNLPAAASSGAIKFTADEEYLVEGVDRSGNKKLERTANSKYSGLTYTDNYYYLNLDDPAFNSLPDAFYSLKGRKVQALTRISRSNPYQLQPTAFSANAVLVLFDYLTGGGASQTLKFGPQMPAGNIDLDSFGAAYELANDVVLGQSNADWKLALPAEVNRNFNSNYAKYSDRLTGLGFGSINDDGIRRWHSEDVQFLRYEYNGAIDTDTDYQSTIIKILSSMPGASLFRSLHNRWRLVLPNPFATAAAQSQMTIMDDVLIELPTIDYPDSADKLNTLTGKFHDLQTDFAGNSITVQLVDSLAEDAGTVLADTIDLHGCNNRYHAYSRLRTEILLSRRNRYKWTMTPAGYLLEPGDVVRLDSDAVAVDVYVRIDSVGVTDKLNIVVEGIEFMPSDYAFIAAPKKLPELQDHGLANVATPEMSVYYVTYGNDLSYWVTVTPAAGKRYDSLEFQRHTGRLSTHPFDPNAPTWLWGYRNNSGYFDFVGDKTSIPSNAIAWIPGTAYQTVQEAYPANIVHGPSEVELQNTSETRWQARAVRGSEVSNWTDEIHIIIPTTRTLDNSIPMPDVVLTSSPSKNTVARTVGVEGNIAAGGDWAGIDHFEVGYILNSAVGQPAAPNSESDNITIIDDNIELIGDRTFTHDIPYNSAGFLGDQWAFTARAVKRNGVVGRWNTVKQPVFHDFSDDLTLPGPVISGIVLELHPTHPDEAPPRWLLNGNVNRPAGTDNWLYWIEWRPTGNANWYRMTPLWRYNTQHRGVNQGTNIYPYYADMYHIVPARSSSGGLNSVEVERVPSGGSMDFRMRLTREGASATGYNGNLGAAANITRWSNAITSGNQSA